MVVIELAKDELAVVTELESLSTLPANDDENVLDVLLTVVILDAKDELLVFMLLCNPSILIAILELVVVSVP